MFLPTVVITTGRQMDLLEEGPWVSQKTEGGPRTEYLIADRRDSTFKPRSQRAPCLSRTAVRAFVVSQQLHISYPKLVCRFNPPALGPSIASRPLRSYSSVPDKERLRRSDRLRGWRGQVSSSRIYQGIEMDFSESCSRRKGGAEGKTTSLHLIAHIHISDISDVPKKQGLNVP